MNYLFITGTGRSGTTLIEKLLHNHPNIGIGSQPFPNLYFRTKTKFYARENLRRRYPVGHLFLERNYTFEELNRFLEGCFFTAYDLAEMFRDMSTYSGQYMPEFLRFCRGQIVPGVFYEVYQQFLSLLATYFDKESLMCVGTKETWLEEFVPFFLDRNVKVIIIIRDPRDVITSFNCGKGVRHGGNIRPLLYILRHWRKSVSFYLKYQHYSHCMLVKYEDLVTNPQQVLGNAVSFLGITPFPENIFSNGITDQKGELWQGNSSFAKYSFINLASVATFKTYLSEECIRYIESVCYPELEILGYEHVCCVNGPDESSIQNFIEPFNITHKKFEPDYSCHPVRIQQELQRLRHFQNNLSEEEQRLWFIFPEAYQTMKRHLEYKR